VLAKGARLNHATLRAALVRPSFKPESRDEPRSTEAADDILLTADVDARACLPDESVRAARVHAAARGYDRHNQDTSQHDVGTSFVRELTNYPHAASSKILANDLRGFALLSYVFTNLVTGSFVLYWNIVYVRKNKRCTLSACLWH